MNYENQSQRSSWFSSGKAIVVLVILAVIGLLVFKRTPVAPAPNSSLSAAVGVSIHALLHASRPRQARRR